MEKEEYEAQIKALKKEIEQLKKKQTYEIKRQKYGLNWIDVPEAFEKDSENKIPVLEEVKDKSIKNDDGKPTHILIEGDNYHALQCLNYTHKGKVDVIYIDPPYNTGNDGFRYKDSRFLDEYPDRTSVSKDHPLRHSYWLSFMNKRLKLAKNLLSSKGVVFISIDDNEQANLKLLCDSIFGETNFLATFSVIVKTEGRRYGGIAKTHEYAFAYAKNITSLKLNEIEVEGKNFKYSDEKGGYNIQDLRNQNARAFNSTNRPNLRYPFFVDTTQTDENGFSKVYLQQKNNYTEVYPITVNGYESVWRWGKKEKAAKNIDELVAKIGSDGNIRIYQKMRKLTEMPKTVLQDKNYLSIKGTREIQDILGLGIFDFPKPLNLINLFITIASNSSSIILDFFAGSGTTLHATMKLNEEDGGNRQCILVQLNENNICEDVTYERNRRVMKGYKNAKGEQVPGLGNSLKYYKTAFIGQNNCKNANDDDRTELAKKAGCLLSLGENTLDEICSTDYYQLFTGIKEATAVYFTDDYEKFDEFKEKVAELAPNFKKTFVYIFAWSSADDFAYEFDDISNIQIKAIPLPILEIYKSIYN